MKHLPRWATLLLAVVLLAQGGCPPPPKPVPANAYYGPILSMPEVLAALRDNGQALPTLWTRHSCDITWTDDAGKDHLVIGEGTLMVRKPRELLLTARKDVGIKLFQAGTTADRFWLTVFPEIETMWWGAFGDSLPGLPEAPSLPIAPDLVMDALGITDIARDFLSAPVPVQRFNHDADCYMITWMRQGTDRWFPIREVWVDRKTLQPREVMIYGPNGNVLVRSSLSEWMDVAASRRADGSPARIARKLSILFPASKALLRMTLEEPALTRNNAPREGLIRFPEEPEVPNVIRVAPSPSQLP